MSRTRLAAILSAAVAAAGAAALAGAFAAGRAPHPPHRAPRTPPPVTSKLGAPRAARVARSAPPYATALRFATFVDRARTVRYADGASAPRTLLTEIYDPPHAAGRLPLIVFGHGFGVTPGVYAALLRAWAAAGFVVAAPLFPAERPNAPGGPTATDLPNEPHDISFVISEMLAASRATGVLHGRIAPSRIAVAGQSDGGDAALAAAYDPRVRDRRIAAAMILSGAEIPQNGAFAFPPHGPPLLATQGSADTINLPSATALFYAAAHPVKYLLTLIGAPHLPPYTTQQPQLGIVERVSVDFLRRYLLGLRSALPAMRRAGTVAGVAAIG